MAISYLESSATIGTTERSLPNDSTTLTPQTTAGQVQVFVDVSAVTGADEFELTFYEKARTADTQRIVSRVSILGVQGRPLYVSPAITFSRGWDITLKKIAGTDRAISWSVRRWPDA